MEFNAHTQSTQMDLSQDKGEISDGDVSTVLFEDSQPGNGGMSYSQYMSEIGTDLIGQNTMSELKDVTMRPTKRMKTNHNAEQKGIASSAGMLISQHAGVSVTPSAIYNQLSPMVFYSKYSRHRQGEHRRETYAEAIDRVLNMHATKYAKYAKALEPYMKRVRPLFHNKVILGSQRAMQFAGRPILDKGKNCRIYNCAASYIDRPRVFQEYLFVLLCGTGVGFSVQSHHIAKLPDMRAPTKGKKIFRPEDSIEGWADCIGVLMSSYFTGKVPFPEYQGTVVEFDLRSIRIKGSRISSSNGKAPGPEPLRIALEHARNILDNASLRAGSYGYISKHKDKFRLKSIEIYDILMHLADCVLAGGVRRSATICLFSPEDNDMMTAKTGPWWEKNPQRGRSNNSALLLRDSVDRKVFDKLFESTKQCGEPGFVFAASKEVAFNPCCEVSLYCRNEAGVSGFQMCNLCEINAAAVKTEAEFYEACFCVGVLGTLQAGYTDVGYVGKVTQGIIEREALLGCSITGIADNPKIALDPRILRAGVKIIKDVNKTVAAIIGIRQSARVTCIKPSGTSSAMLGTSSGIHARHARRNFRRMQMNSSEDTLLYFKKFNPAAVEKMQGSGKEVITFLCKAPVGAKTKLDVKALDLLKMVKLVQENWVVPGSDAKLSVKPYLQHNVSNTINVDSNEWDAVADYIFKNRKHFTGISLIGTTGDLDYEHAPFQRVRTGVELNEEYGVFSHYASGLIVHALSCFETLYKACTCLEFNSPLEVKFDNDNISASIEAAKVVLEKQGWVARAKKVAKKYFSGNIKKLIYCMKDVDASKHWTDLEMSYVDVPWEKYYEEEDQTNFTSEPACSGGSCEMKFM
jgi:ribonucleoside-diphosphate reductase alpha chain